MCIATLWSVIKSNEKKGELNSKQIVTHGLEFIETIKYLVDFIGFSLTSIAAYYSETINVHEPRFSIYLPNKFVA